MTCRICNCVKAERRRCPRRGAFWPDSLWRMNIRFLETFRSLARLKSLDDVPWGTARRVEPRKRDAPLLPLVLRHGFITSRRELRSLHSYGFRGCGLRGGD